MSLRHDPAEPADSAQDDGTPANGEGLSRRGLMRWTGAAGLGAAGAALLPQSALAATPKGAPAAAAARRGTPALPAFDPVRPPAVPLAVRSPYLSTWSADDNLAGTWPGFWTGRTTAMVGYATVDGDNFLFLGDPAVDSPAPRGMVQKSLTVTATRSVYVLTGGGVELTLTFLSPVEPGDLRRQSVPLSYITADVRSTDGHRHKVGLYFDISGEWASGDAGTKIGWKQEKVNGAGGASVTTMSCTPADPTVIGEKNDMATWGSVVFSATDRPGLTWQIGPDTTVRPAALKDGKLAGTSDSDQPRAINDHWPVFAYHFDLGTVASRKESAVLSIGHVREPAVAYLGDRLPPLWRSHWDTWQSMVSDFHADLPGAEHRTASLDRRIRREATAAGGARYAALCALALRQAYAGTELVSRNGKPWAFLKEISSDGNMSTLDVTYPGVPAFLVTDPEYLGLLLAPMLDYAENGGWPKDFAEHDLGSHYPDASGHNDGNEEDMPVEESANAIIMSAAYLDRTSAGNARTFATGHYTILKKWADYLVANALDPAYQNQTDDFTGFIGHSVNLALKGIIAIGAMSKIAKAAGNTADAASYLSTAKSYIAQWVDKAQDGDAGHLKLAYDQPGTWSLKYNGYPDQLLKLNLIPREVAKAEGDWYLSRANQYGIPLDIRHSYTKGDWEMWTAAWLHDHPVRDYLIDSLYDFAHSTPSRVPFSDWYDTIDDRPSGGFKARPVIGGVFALLSLRS
ncbi:glutaminase family protein [Streptomyces montanisoli]|uniref:DUF5127 domain-containing protein n=1 Tax=Streptomyces montanisoli TaxID=2798581 RepID=A0A940M9M4_9ACTN|nr:glutaminase family protein [Streptomyces montanisoli]MBP0456898.1 DUF5127 domain-containing protein [Streptomyces montanisoli]